MDVTRLTVIISQHIQTLNHYVTHLNEYANYSSFKKYTYMCEKKEYVSYLRRNLRHGLT